MICCCSSSGILILRGGIGYSAEGGAVDRGSMIGVVSYSKLVYNFI